MEYANDKMGGGGGLQRGLLVTGCVNKMRVFCVRHVFWGFFLAAQHFSVAHRLYFSEMTLGGSFTPQGIWSESANTASTLAVGRDADLKFLSLGDGGSEDGCAAVESFLERFLYCAILSGSFCLPEKMCPKIS